MAKICKTCNCESSGCVFLLCMCDYMCMCVCVFLRLKKGCMYSRLGREAYNHNSNPAKEADEESHSQGRRALSSWNARRNEGTRGPANLSIHALTHTHTLTHLASLQPATTDHSIPLICLLADDHKQRCRPSCAGLSEMLQTGLSLGTTQLRL